MLGGIYGDLAASTYLQNPKVFYKKLFDERATLSEYGLTILAQAELCGLDCEASNEVITKVKDRYFKINNVPNVSVSKSLLYSEDNLHKRAALIAINYATSAWWIENEDDKPYNIIPFDSFPFEKSDGYARMFLIQIIGSLLNGLTKDQVYKKLGNVFSGIFHEWDWRTEEGDILSYILRAWDNFYRAFDFGSAVHNAVKCVGDIRLNATLTGMIAEAMYGCGFYFVKKKFSGDDCSNQNIELPTSISETFDDSLEVIREQKCWRSIFFKKNNARTNVEYHSFTPIENKYGKKIITEELHRRILTAFVTGWDNRYGFYFDNGWVYTYRSFCLIGRFRLKKLPDGTYRIVDTQESGENHDFNIALHEALDVCEYGWMMFSDFRFKYFHPFSETADNPFESGSTKGKIWYGEKMFYDTQMENIYHWINLGKKILRERKEPRLYTFARKLGLERFAVAIYINMLYDKWCPYDNSDWIFSY